MYINEVTATKTFVYFVQQVVSCHNVFGRVPLLIRLEWQMHKAACLIHHFIVPEQTCRPSCCFYSIHGHTGYGQAVQN